MKVRFDLVFNRKKTEGKGLVQIRAYLDGKRRYFSTGYYLTNTEWDKKRNTAKSIEIAKDLKLMIARFEEFEKRVRENQGFFVITNFDDFYRVEKPKQTEPKISFTAFFEEQIEKERIKKVTATAHKNTLKILQEFQVVIWFDDLNVTLIEAFEIFLYKKKYSVNYINRLHRHVRKYINIAIKKELFEERKSPYKNFEIKSEETETLFLLPEELERIEQLEFAPNEFQLERSRDMFLFGAYTGLRFSDIYALEEIDFRITNEGLMLEFSAIKTGKHGKKPLWILHAGKPQKIILKYLEKLKDKNYKRLFHGCNNPQVNLDLKIIARRARVNSGLYFKASRDTFATHLALVAPISVVQKQLQHSKLSTTQKYVHLAEEIEFKELRRIWKDE